VAVAVLVSALLIALIALREARQTEDQAQIELKNTGE